MSDSIFDMWPPIAFKYPHAAMPFSVSSGRADKKAQVLPPLVLVGKFKSCNHQQGCSNRAGAPNEGLTKSSSDNFPCNKCSEGEAYISLTVYGIVYEELRC